MCNKERILEVIRQHDEFVKDVDGYFYYSPENHRGHMSASALRIIADELDRINAEWDAHIRTAFAAIPKDQPDTSDF